MLTQKKWEDLELKDDFMFAKVMRDPELCREMLERLLDFRISRIEYTAYDSQSVRLDIYVQDEENTVYNIEIQTTDTKELPKRSRYYQGMIDLDLIEKGEHYKKLNKSYVIFICTFDLFGKGFYRYTFENLCKEDSTIALNDQTTKLFFNTSGTIGDLSNEAIAFLKYVGGTPSDDDFVRKLQIKVNSVRENKQWRREYMTLLMRDKENRKLGRQEGILEGRQESILKVRQEDIQAGKIQTIKILLRKGLLSEVEIISEMDVSPEELQEIKNSLNE
ncbi:MAG: Rpn family recombination-promoting nuclease/putative transposase [Lachnospiraceae bacterium]|nr:Rpn family recombination-promoting nuclease/putative transposase [Lachnospiraceae bacterium]